jgi:hypothetical protein
MAKEPWGFNFFCSEFLEVQKSMFLKLKNQNFTINDKRKGFVISTNQCFGEKYPKFITFQGKMGCNPIYILLVLQIANT